MCSVADELTFDRVLAALPELDRTSVERVLRSRGYGTGIMSRDLSEAREQGYHAGVAEGRRTERAEQAKGKPA